jgi:hypothetical protein
VLPDCDIQHLVYRIFCLKDTGIRERERERERGGGGGHNWDCSFESRGMATREAMEQLKATLNGKDSPLYHPPTLRPGIGPPRCPRCSAPLSNDLVNLCCPHPLIQVQKFLDWSFRGGD